MAGGWRRLRADPRGRDDCLELSQVARRRLGPGDTGEDHELAVDLEDVHDASRTRGQRKKSRFGGIRPNLEQTRIAGLADDLLDPW
jgi:hypothetical protein